nr:hypothetical protein DM860_006341 [Ipomoea trifida]
MASTKTDIQASKILNGFQTFSKHNNTKKSIIINQAFKISSTVEATPSTHPCPPSQELFYFFSDFASAADRCGKIVRGGDAAVAERNEAREVDCFRSSSFSGKREAREVLLSSSPSQKVNISSLASMSAKSMRRTFIFGSLKFKPEMDLVAIKEANLPTCQQAPSLVSITNSAGKMEDSPLTKSGLIIHKNVTLLFASPQANSITCLAVITVMLPKFTYTTEPISFVSSHFIYSALSSFHRLHPMDFNSPSIGN